MTDIVVRETFEFWSRQAAETCRLPACASQNPKSRPLCSQSLPFNRNHRDRVIIGVTQSDPAGFHATALGQNIGAAVQNQKRFAALFLVHIDVTPAHGFSDASTECFRYCFLCGEPRREMARRKFHRPAIANFAFSENPFDEPFTKAIKRMLNAFDLSHVDANSEYAHVIR